MIADLTEASTGRKIWVFGGIKGLVRDGDEFKKFVAEIHPDVIFVSISEEEISGLREFLKNPFEMNLSDYEIIYGARLSVFGEVMTPPPVYVESLQYADENSIPILPLDMAEREYSDLYTRSVKPTDLVMHSLRKKRILKSKITSDTPEDFVLDWMKQINKIKGLKKVDDERLEHMKRMLKEYLDNPDYKNPLVVIDYEFYGDVVGYLETSRCNSS